MKKISSILFGNVVVTPCTDVLKVKFRQFFYSMLDAELKKLTHTSLVTVRHLGSVT